MNKTKWIIFSLIVVAFFGGIIWLSKNNDQNNSFNGDAAKVIQEGQIADHVSGAAEQKVVLIEYGDFQCPGCGSMHEPVEMLTDKYKDKVPFVFRNLPLTNIQPLPRQPDYKVNFGKCTTCCTETKTPGLTRHLRSAKPSLLITQNRSV